MNRLTVFLAALLLVLFVVSSFTRASGTPALAPGLDGQTPHLDGAMGVAAMKKFTEIYAPPLIQPNGKGVKPEELAELRRLTARDNPLIDKLAQEHAKMKKDEFGGFRSPVSVPLNEVMGIFTRLSHAYAVAKPADATKIEAMTCDLCKQLLDLGIGEGDIRSAWALAIGDQDARGLLRMREALAKAGVLEPMVYAIAWWNSPKYLPDQLNSAGAKECGHLWQRLPVITFVALASLPDSPEKLRRIRMMQQYVSLVIEGGGIQPGGENIFHGAFHLAYSSAVPAGLVHVANLKKAGFPVTRTAQERLRAFGRLVAKITMFQKVSPNLWMRAGTEGDYGLAARTIQKLADMGDPDAPGILDREMAALYLTVIEQDQQSFQVQREAHNPNQSWYNRYTAEVSATVQRYRAAGITPASLDGCIPMPARPGLLWRNGAWMITAVGSRPDFGGIEMYGWVTPPCNAYVCNGSVLAMRKGDPRYAVGFASTNGWNWSLWPAATTLVKRDSELTSCRSVAGMKSDSPVGGVLTLGTGHDATGLLALHYRGKDYQGDELSFCKSVFMFGGRVLVMTSGITSAAPYPCATTLYQEVLDHPASTTGELPADTPLKAPSGIRYTVLSASQIGSTLRVVNRHQSWRTPNPARVKPGVQYPALLYLLGFNQQAPWKNLPNPSQQSLNANMDEMLNDFLPGEGDFAVAYLDHGVKPSNAACAFLMSIRGEPDAVSVRVKRLDADAHCAYDEVAKTWVYASFKPDTSWTDCGVVKHVGRSMALLAKEGNGRLHLTLASWEEENMEAYSATLRGRWSVAAGPATAKTAANETVLTMPYASYQSCQVVLKEIR